MEWFRLHTSILNNRKADSLPADLYKTWIKLLAVAADFGQEGALPDLRDAAYQMRMSEGDLRSHVASLIDAGLIDEIRNETLDETRRNADETLLMMHDWDHWQYQNGARPVAKSTSTERVRRYREKLKRSETVPETQEKLFHETLRNADETQTKRSETVSETPSRIRADVYARTYARSDSETETDTEAEKNIGGKVTSNIVAPNVAAEITSLLHGFVKERGDTADWPPPDAKMVSQIASILNGSGPAGLCEFLDDLRRHRKYPKTSYAYFPPLLQQWKARRASPSPTPPPPPKKTWKCDACLDLGRTFEGHPPANGAELEAAMPCLCRAGLSERGRRETEAAGLAIAATVPVLPPLPTSPDSSQTISEFLPKSAKSTRRLDK